MYIKFYADTSADAKNIKDLMLANDEKLQNKISIYCSLNNDLFLKQNLILENVKSDNEKSDIKLLQGKYICYEVKAGSLIMEKCIDKECVKSEFYVLIGSTLYGSFTSRDAAIDFIDRFHFRKNNIINHNKIKLFNQ